jgi:hypothetical protein
MSKCQHDAVEQVRGKMGPGDYFDAIANSLDSHKNDRLDDNYHENVELYDGDPKKPEESNKTDMRIICKKCFLSTGWMKVDAPNMPAGVGVPAVQAKWSDIKQYDADEWNAHLRTSGVRSKTVNFGS